MFLKRRSAELTKIRPIFYKIRGIQKLKLSKNGNSPNFVCPVFILQNPSYANKYTYSSIVAQYREMTMKPDCLCKHCICCFHPNSFQNCFKNTDTARSMECSFKHNMNDQCFQNLLSMVQICFRGLSKTALTTIFNGCQRSYQRWLDERIYKTEMKFWAVLGSRDCREKNLPTAISMQLFGVFFFMFSRAKNIYIFFF